MTIEERNKLVEDNLELVHYVLHKYIRYTPLFEYDDLYQEGCIGLINAADKYNGSTKFSTYAVIAIKNAVLCHMRYFCEECRNPELMNISLYTEVSPSSTDKNSITIEDVLPDSLDIADEVYAREGFHRAWKQTSKRDRDVIEYAILHCNSNLQRECSVRFNISQPTVHRIIKAFKCRVNEYVGRT